MNIKIAIVQMKVSSVLEKNLEYIKNTIHNSSAELIVFPELCLTGYQKSKQNFNFCKIQKALIEISYLAKEKNKSLIIGLPILEKDKIYNATAFIKNNGEIECKAEKLLLYPELDEPLFEPGRKKEFYIFKGKKLGIIICFELRMPEVARALVKAGADVLIVLAQWPKSRIFQWKTLLQARAIENQIPIIGVNALTTINGLSIGGESRIISSKGKVLAKIKQNEEILEYDLKIETPSYPYPLKTPFCEFSKKIIDLTQLKELLEKRRKKGQKIVFTNGCFDILHAGHVHYLKTARKLGDILIVGLNTDASVKKIKGKNRPVNNEKYRAEVLAGLEAVDFVVFFEEETPLNLIKEIRPDILVKGADWEESKIVGADFVKSYGGKVVRIPFQYNVSTTSIIEKIKKNT